MRRTVLLRALTAIWSFWFAAAFLELPVVHACAVHGTAAGATAGHHAHHHGSSSSQPNQKGPQCTCLSQCSGSSPAVLATSPLVASTSTIEVDRVEHRALSVILVARAHAQPFANGPPVA